MANSVELNSAITQHAVWKIHFVRDVIATGRSDFPTDKIRSSHLCDFGKWMDSLSLEEKDLDEYKKTQLLHDKFHRAAADVLQLALSGQKEKSHGAVSDFTSDFVCTSAQLVNALARWKKKMG